MGVNAAIWEHAPPPQKFLKPRSSKMLFSAFSTRCFVTKSISIKCKMTGVFSGLQIDFVTLIHIP